MNNSTAILLLGASLLYALYLLGKREQSTQRGGIYTPIPGGTAPKAQAAS